MSELAIVVVHYHAEELLAQCIESLRASAFADFDAVVVDNGSTRDLSWVEDDSRFQLYRADSNLGFAVATNLALRQLPTDSEFVLSLNPDVVLQPRTLAEMVLLMKSNVRLGAATCRLVLPDSSLDPACRRSEPTPWSALSKQLGLSRLANNSRFFGSYNLTHLDPAKPHLIDAGTGAFLLVRRSALEASGGGMDERFFLYGEDLDLCRQLRETGYDIQYWPTVSATHNKGSGRLRPARSTAHFYRAMWLYYRKWGRFKKNPAVLAPLLLALGGLGTIELVRNEVQRLFRRFGPAKNLR